jgi:amino acid adenylation domain-containing protein
MLKPRLVQNFMDEHVSRSPARTAVVDDQASLSYGTLDELSNQLAHCLVAHGLKRQDRVAFSMQRSMHCLTAILGILKADAVYVSLDPKTTDLRRSSILAECRPRAIICDRSTLKQFDLAASAQAGMMIIVLDPEQSPANSSETHSIGWDEIVNCSCHRPDCLNQDDDLAYIMFTSCSTGHPKGVMISHRNIYSYIDWAVACFGLGPADRILCTAPFHFDMSTFDVYAALKAGGTLCIANDMMTLFPEKLVRFIEEQEITVWKGVSSLLMYLVRTGVIGPERMPTLGTIMFGGEPLATRYLQQWMQTYPDKRFVNAYGPTEATGVSLYHMVDRIPSSVKVKIPIGKPCTDTEVFLLKEDMSLAVPGEVGELCISGPCLSKGYLNDPLKTAEAFIESGPGNSGRQRYYRTGDLVMQSDDGTYVYLSRKDNQVKIMGYRVDLGEVEHALLTIDGVDDAVVLVAEDAQSGLKELIAYYESACGLVPGQVVAELKMHVPGYMLPKRLQSVEKIPRNDRGKIDRQRIFDDNVLKEAG